MNSDKHSGQKCDKVRSKSKELVTEHVVVHARTGKWASEHVEFIQDAAHAPNVLKQKLSTYLAMQILSLKLPSDSDEFVRISVKTRS